MLFSILAPLENAVRWVLERFHYNLGFTWAWAIVGTTIAVRVLLVPLAVRQIHSMQAVQRVAPELKEIQRKYKGDRQRQQEETMKFYREHKINPVASFLPLLAQAPVFLSLWLVLRNFSKHIPPGSDLSWLHFVHDITAKASSSWGGYLLLAAYALSQVASTYFVSTTTNKTQRRLLIVLPLIYVAVIARFPIGLVIYLVTTTLWTIGQGVMTRRLVPRTAVAPALPRRSSRTPPPAPAVPGGGNGAKAEPVETAAAPAPKQRRPSAQPRRVKRGRGHGRR